jgi:hypothetical protein
MKQRTAPKADTGHVAGIAREKIDQRKEVRLNEAKTMPGETNIQIILKYHREKAEYSRIKRKRECHATQDPQNRLRISNMKRFEMRGRSR